MAPINRASVAVREDIGCGHCSSASGHPHPVIRTSDWCFSFCTDRADTVATDVPIWARFSGCCDSNPRRLAWEASTLPLSYTRPNPIYFNPKISLCKGGAVCLLISTALALISPALSSLVCWSLGRCGNSPAQYRIRRDFNQPQMPTLSLLRNSNHT